ncbi:hypothetical protein MSAN_01614000 [Mycena sanguinolenta]|uniref:Ricin B lectin domain-containing protein n=1 Tax=Mycena sanguinolenta TaxID=230812 RepID=A0A8H7CU54_9AGAR|nr:hypothetical protein MSAN_01614000 [Mycena sanguinolenta]
MFSFSKVLAFGLVAFSSVRAVPFMQTSCIIDIGTSVGPAHAFNVPNPNEVYKIVNVATNTAVQAFGQDSVVGMEIKDQFPPYFAHWQLIRATQGGGFKIRSVAFGTIFTGNDKLFTGFSRPSEAFTVESAGEDQFIIKEVNSDQDWTVEYDREGHQILKLAPSKGKEHKEQKWRFVPVGN